MKRSVVGWLVLVGLWVGVVGGSVAAERDLRCRLAFTSSEWSAIYTSALGEGTVTCSDGTSMRVAIRVRGVGLSAGKWKITEGKGTFIHVAGIEDVLGDYLSLGADAGAVKSGTARVLTKGKVSLALAGKGEGFDTPPPNGRRAWPRAPTRPVMRSSRTRRWWTRATSALPTCWATSWRRPAQSHRCGHLVLVAPPRFLGMLHAAMDPPLRDRVSGELHHDFTAFPATDVRERVLHALLS